MGQQSQKVFISQVPHQTVKNKHVTIFKQSTQNNKFHQIDPCYYPHQHQLKQQKKKNNQQEKQEKQKNKNQPQFQQESSKKSCSRKHDPNISKSFNLCSQCERLPHKTQKNAKLKYQESTYKPKPIRQQNFNKKSDFKEPGFINQPRQPKFYNAFSLPIERYMRQKPTISQNQTEVTLRRDQLQDHLSPQKLQQSIFKTIRDIDLNNNIEFEGYRQNLQV